MVILFALYITSQPLLLAHLLILSYLPTSHLIKQWKIFYLTKQMGWLLFWISKSLFCTINTFICKVEKSVKVSHFLQDISNEKQKLDIKSHNTIKRQNISSLRLRQRSHKTFDPGTVSPSGHRALTIMLCLEWGKKNVYTVKSSLN